VKDIYQLLREKEQRIEQLRREVEALRAVAPMLADQSDPAAELSSLTLLAPLSYGPDESVPAGAVFSSWAAVCL
jgi:hypothetical protein